MSAQGSGALLDRGVAERTAAATVAGLGRLGSRSPAPDPYRREEVRAACEEGIGVAAQLSGLGPVAGPPMAELIDRRAWASNALDSIAAAAGHLGERIPGGLGLPGPLGGIATRGVGIAIGAEAGAAAGYAASRVLGQYDLSLIGPPRPARLLFVGANLDAARRELGADRAQFLRWIAIHETTHVLQLESVEWLAAHIRGLATGLLDAAAEGLERRSLGDLGRRLLRAPGDLVRAALHGELARLLADPAQRAALDRLQATMAVIEGHAEHVMDGGDELLGPGVEELRRRMDRRRADRGGLAEIVSRLMGMDMKLRQYELGKAFCDRVAGEAGEDALRLVWRSPDDLPNLAELEAPGRWLERVGPPVAA